MGILGGPDEDTTIVTDPATPVGMVRLLITDLDPNNLLFPDATIERFLTVEGDNAKLAAASLLDVIATSTALIMRKFSTQDLTVDGPAVAASLMKQADRLRQQVTDGDAGDEGYAFDSLPLWSFPTANPYGDCLL